MAKSRGGPNDPTLLLRVTIFSLPVAGLKRLIWLQIIYYRHVNHRNEFFIPENGIKHVSHVLVINHAKYMFDMYINHLEMTLKWQNMASNDLLS